jgi:hypothetical protein
MVSLSDKFGQDTNVIFRLLTSKEVGDDGRIDLVAKARIDEGVRLTAELFKLGKIEALKCLIHRLIHDDASSQWAISFGFRWDTTIRGSTTKRTQVFSYGGPNTKNKPVAVAKDRATTTTVNGKKTARKKGSVGHSMIVVPTREATTAIGLALQAAAGRS